MTERPIPHRLRIRATVAAGVATLAAGALTTGLVLGVSADANTPTDSAGTGTSSTGTGSTTITPTTTSPTSSSSTPSTSTSSSSSSSDSIGGADQHDTAHGGSHGS